MTSRVESFLPLTGAPSHIAALVRRSGAKHWPVLPVVALAAVLHSWALTSVGWGNAYYAAAVRSMTSSWKNFLFVSLDSEGFVAVDKPPLSLWLQAIGARIFGFSKVSILAPQAIAGTLAVVVVYLGVRSAWGRWAGVIAAICLALTPINVMVNHSNNTDSVLVLVMTSAASLTIYAVGKGRLRWFVLACAVAGTAMTAKMLAAVPVMPGVLLAYAWCASRSWKVRLGHLAVGALTMAVAALWWFALVDAWPKDSRPYVGSSATNSAFQLAFERNGVNQVDGPQTMGGGRAGAAGRPGGGFPGGRVGGFPGGRAAGGGPGGPGGIPQQGFNGGQPGRLRLFNESLGSQIAWTLPLALVGSLAALVVSALRGSKKLSALIVFGGWLVSGGGVFSITKGIVHPYYMANIGPPISALTGIGVVALVTLARRWRLRGAAVLLGAVGLTAFAQWTMLGRASFDGWRGWLRPTAVVLLVLGGLACVASISLKRRRIMVGSVGVLTLAAVLAPFMLVQTSLARSVSPQLPYASIAATGRSIGGALRPNGGFTYLAGDQKALVEYLRAQRGSSTWSVAVQSAAQAETLIIEYGEPVMVLGGFSGSDPILTADQLREKVAAGEVRYFLSGGSGPGGGGFGGGGFGGPGGFADAGGSGTGGVITGATLGGLLSGVPPTGTGRVSTGTAGASVTPGGTGGTGGTASAGTAGGGASPLNGLLPGRASQNSSARARVPTKGGGFGGRAGGFGGTNASSFVTTECKEVPQTQWLRGGASTTGDTSFPGGPTSSSFSLYDCGSLSSVT